MNLVRISVGLLSIASLSSCGVRSDDASALKDTVAQQSADVVILQAWTGDFKTLDYAQCAGQDPSLDQTSIKDCSAQAAILTQASWANRGSPSVNPWLLEVRNYHHHIYAANAGGNLVEIRALVKRAVLDAPTFKGIGFYFDNMTSDGVIFVPKADLHVVSNGDVTLKSGESAAVLRFVGWMPGQAGNSGTGWCMNSVEFKPYARFESDGRTFENWDHRNPNYRIYRCANGGGTAQVNSFDRQGELLR